MDQKEQAHLAELTLRMGMFPQYLELGLGNGEEFMVQAPGKVMVKCYAMQHSCSESPEL